MKLEKAMTFYILEFWVLDRAEGLLDYVGVL